MRMHKCISNTDSSKCCTIIKNIVILQVFLKMCLIANFNGKFNSKTNDVKMSMNHYRIMADTNIFCNISCFSVWLPVKSEVTFTLVLLCFIESICLLSFTHRVHSSPFSLLFFALSDLPQDSSDEEQEEEEEEDFSGVQFGSRYRCQSVLHASACCLATNNSPPCPVWAQKWAKKRDTK